MTVKIQSDVVYQSMIEVFMFDMSIVLNWLKTIPFRLIDLICTCSDELCSESLEKVSCSFHTIQLPELCLMNKI